LCPGRMIGGNHPCFIIAEIGQNHQGNMEIAKEMIKMAKVNESLVNFEELGFRQVCVIIISPSTLR
ncbi:hypothetical protein XENOCAPTIV_023568, partial [Xenoophorus captivus]